MCKVRGLLNHSLGLLCEVDRVHTSIFRVFICMRDLRLSYRLAMLLVTFLHAGSAEKLCVTVYSANQPELPELWLIKVLFEPRDSRGCTGAASASTHICGRLVFPSAQSFSSWLSEEAARWIRFAFWLAESPEVLAETSCSHRSTGRN